MKKNYVLLLILIILLTACTKNITFETESEKANTAETQALKGESDNATETSTVNEETDKAAEIAAVKSVIESYFEEVGNRDFDISFPVEINGEKFYKIVVSGKLNNNETYPIDTFAINPNNEKRYFYRKETAEYVQYYTTPTFAAKTSSDGKLRIESVGMYQDGPSGLFALKEMRIINTSNADVLWSNDSYLMNGFMWSEDNRFVAATYSGRQWVKTDIIDTKDYSVITIPDINDILKDCPNAEKPSDNVPMPIFQAVNWVTSSVILIHFEWSAENDISVLGEYEFNLDSGKMDIKKIESIRYD
jgi:hypothetical protein